MQLITKLKNIFGSQRYYIYLFLIVIIVGLYQHFSNQKNQSYTINNLTPRPPMGWNGWNKFRCSDEINEGFIKRTADALVTSGMKDAGYTYVNLDDCWQVDRDADGNIIPDPKKFPHGIKYLSGYIHSKGLKFGIYTSAGSKTCEGRPGSLGFERSDVVTYAGWGVDYIKVDWCQVDYLDPMNTYTIWRDEIKKSGRPMVLSAAIGKPQESYPWIWGRYTVNLWRTTSDILDYWEDIVRILYRNSKYAPYGGSGAWNDPDMLQVGNGNMTNVEYKTHFSMWAMMAAPLIAGNDIRLMDDKIREILTNREVIAVDQDPLGIQAYLVTEDGQLQIWSKPLRFGGSRVIAFLNLGNSLIHKTIKLKNLELMIPVAFVRDLWNHSNEGLAINTYSISVPPHAVKIVKLFGLFNPATSFSEQIPVPLHTGFLSDQNWLYAENGFGPVERNTSNGEGLPDDGGIILLYPGLTYAKGLGVHAYSKIIFTLDGKCSLFSAHVGLDMILENPDAAAYFSISLDGQPVYRTKPMTSQKPYEEISVNVVGAETLTLDFYSSNPKSNNFLHGNWADAKIICN